jgi:LysM repeat protein
MTFPARPADRTPTPAQSDRRRLYRWGAAIGALALLVTQLPAVAHEHTVAPGEALSTIASQYSVSTEDLVEANGLTNPDLIFAGQSLTVPTAKTPLSSPQTRKPADYTVEAGDNPWGIADRVGVSLMDLLERNGLESSSVIHPGQVLDLPGSATAGPEPVEYVVVPGDTLSEIARAHGVSLDDLLDANALTRSSVIVPDQRLAIAASGRATADVIDVPSAVPVELAADADKLKLIPVFRLWAGAYNVPADLLMGLAWFESGWNNELESSAGALGIGQVLPITGAWVAKEMIGAELDLAVPKHNIRIAARYLRYLLTQTSDERQAVASYYQGLTATRQHGIFESSEFYVDGVLSIRERFA